MTKAERWQKVAWLAVPSIGRATFRRLLVFAQQQQVGLAELWQYSGILAELGPLNERKQKELKNFKKNYTINSFKEYLKAKNIFPILEDDEEYPELLLGIEDRPVLLFCQGKVDLLRSPKPLAVVGTRRMTAYGRIATEQLCTGLVAQGFCIVSGFMYGVDSQAHRVALESGGHTIGVLGYGHNHIAPSKQRHLAQELLATGNLLISEYPPDTKGTAGSFPQRNRIVAGMSLGVLVVEAALKSGSHITAHCALEYGRLVAAVPGPITSFYSEGTKWLINQGALLVSQASDISVELALPEESKQNTKISVDFSDLPTAAQAVCQTLQNRQQSTDELLAELGLELSELSTILTLLEMRSVIYKLGKSWFLR